MAEGQRWLTRTSGFGTTLSGVAENRYVALALQWYGVPLAAAFGLLASLYYMISPEVWRPTYDDSYISLTFARNLAEHGKMSLDGQEWTTGATSPLHVAIMAVWLKVGASPFFTSAAVDVIWSTLLAVGVYLMGFAIFRSRLAGVLAALAISSTSYVALDSGNGLETSQFMALIAFAGAAFFWNDRPATRIVCGVLIGLAILTRPEGAFLIPAVLIYRWLERPAGEPLAVFGKDAARLAVPGLIAGGMIVLFSLIVSGTLGGTGNAKLSFFQEDETALQFKISLASDQVGLFLAPLIPLIALAAIVAGRRAVLFAVLFCVPVLVFYVYLFPGGLAHYFYRYQHPVLPFLAVFAGGGAAYLIAMAMQRDLVVKTLVVLGLILAIVPMQQQYVRWRGIYTQAVDEVHANLEPMAIDLNTIVKPDEALASHDIGAVSYFADYEVVDLVGLVNEDVIKYHDKRELGAYIDLVRPDYVLLFSEWDRDFLHLNVAAQPEKYELVKAYEGGSVRWQTYYLYRVHYP